MNVDLVNVQTYELPRSQWHRREDLFLHGDQPKGQLGTLGRTASRATGGRPAIETTTPHLGQQAARTCSRMAPYFFAHTGFPATG